MGWIILLFFCDVARGCDDTLNRAHGLILLFLSWSVASQQYSGGKDVLGNIDRAHTLFPPPGKGGDRVFSPNHDGLSIPLESIQFC